MILILFIADDTQYNKSYDRFVLTHRVLNCSENFVPFVENACAASNE